MKKSLAALSIALLPAATALAHPGHHHDRGLPDFSAHLVLGLEYLAGILAVATVGFFLRRAFKKKSVEANRPPENS